MIADLKKCFFHIGISPELQNLFHILWFTEDDLECEIEIWCFTVHVWGRGVVLSPFIAIILTRCIHQVAKENRTKASPPLTLNSLMRNMYVDDLLCSLDTIQEVCTLYSESKELFADSSFKLTKCSTNAPEVDSNIPETDCEPSAPALQGTPHLR